MFLKSIRMQGFKSFADRVQLDFGPGVACLVGPNGCGKSNVVDAFKWVLGEQSAKSLRGRQMQDMIFNGSSSRRSSGMAQVDLLFDNSDRALAFDTDEVVVTRKLYRSGESAYQLGSQLARLKDIRELFLGSQLARLKDIRELFLDTGVATDAYSVIEQGKVDVLLQSSPQERRAIFEEAAGISKYKARKREAERKLDRTQQNLLRIEDIIGELDKRLRSVKYQAGKARHYQAYEARLNELRASYAMAEYHRLTGDLDRLQTDANRASDEVTALRTRIDANEAEASQMSIRADSLANELSAAENELVAVRADASAQDERIASARRRIDEQSAVFQRAARQCDANRARMTELATELEDLQRQAQELSSQTQAQNDIIQKLNIEDQQCARELTHTQQLLEDEKAGIIELLRRTAQLHNEIASLDTHRESLVGRQGALAHRDATIADELRACWEQKAALEQQQDELDKLIEAERRRLDEKKREAQQLDATRAQLAEALAQAKEQRSGLYSRKQLLQDLEQRMEGIGAAVRHLLEQKSRPPDDLTDGQDLQLASIWGVVADAFDAEVVHAAVIEAAVGSLSQHLVVKDTDPFLADPELFANLPGRLTAICLDRLPPVINQRDFSDQPGFVARAIELVHVPEPVEALVRHLLAKTVVVRGLSDALRMAALDATGHRFVTLAGQVVEPDGRIHLGPPTAEAGLISRRSELRAIDGQIADQDEQIRTLADRVGNASAAAAHLDELQHELRTAIYESHTAKVETNAKLQHVMENIRRLSGEQPVIAAEVESIQKQIREAAARSTANEASLGEIEDENRTRQEETARHQTRIDALAERREALGQQLTEARVAAAHATEKRRATAEAVALVRRNMREAEQAVETAVAEGNEAQARIEDSQTTIQNCRARLEEVERLARTLEARTLQLGRDREMTRYQAEELAAATKNCRAALAEAEARLHQTQIDLNESRVHREGLTTRVADELGIDLVALYASYDHADQDWDAVEQEIGELKGKIRRLGNVNLDAITEQDELEQRHTFLTEQRDDLAGSHKELERLIHQLNVESRRRFQEAFEKIRENFRGLFRRLFAGGKADIVLEDSDDILECGIEVVARPPGKELQSISLLSGGEKAMTAIALLMAIFRSRPSPFAILDEVDAALDEANNERFNGIIQDFLDKSQFIIITHSKRTMTIADRMYGVTMQEPGVSTPVSVSFEDHSAPDEHAVA
jgi:chromosome segregation protein